MASRDRFNIRADAVTQPRTAAHRDLQLFRQLQQLERASAPPDGPAYASTQHRRDRIRLRLYRYRPTAR